MSIVPGSLSSVAAQSGRSLAESFLHCDAIVIVDTSGSMSGCDAPGGRSRYQSATAELEALQQQLPGKIAVLAFSDRCEFCPGGIPVFLGSGTDVAGALSFARLADVPGMQFYLISDGEPDSEGDALAVAALYQAHINTIYVGPERGTRGRAFLAKLAAATGGQSAVAELTKALGETVKRQMLTAVH